MLRETKNLKVDVGSINLALQFVWGSSRSQAVASGRRQSQALEMPFFAGNPLLRCNTMGCDPSADIFSCALCHESSFYNTSILTENPVFVPEGTGSVTGDYNSHPVEVNNVRVERAKRRKAKVPCLQPLVLTRCQRAIADATV